MSSSNNPAASAPSSTNSSNVNNSSGSNNVNTPTTSANAAASNKNRVTNTLAFRGVEWLSPTGRTLTLDERHSIAKRRGVCVHCGVRTHQRFKFRVKAVTDEYVHNGRCIRCDPDSCPAAVVQAWKERQATPMMAMGQPGVNNRNSGSHRHVGVPSTLHPRSRGPQSQPSDHDIFVQNNNLSFASLQVSPAEIMESSRLTRSAGTRPRPAVTLPQRIPALPLTQPDNPAPPQQVAVTAPTPQKPAAVALPPQQSQQEQPVVLWPRDEAALLLELRHPTDTNSLLLLLRRLAREPMPSVSSFDVSVDSVYSVEWNETIANALADAWDDDETAGAIGHLWWRYGRTGQRLLTRPVVAAIRRQCRDQESSSDNENNENASLAPLGLVADWAARSPDLRQALAHAGAVEVLLEVLKDDQHPQDAPVRMLWTLRATDAMMGPSRVADERDCVVDRADGIEDNVHQEDSIVAIRDEWVRGGGVASVMKVLRENSEEDLLLLWGLVVLSHVVDSDNHIRRCQTEWTEFTSHAVKILKSRATGHTLFNLTAGVLEKVLAVPSVTIEHDKEALASCVPAVAQVLKESGSSQDSAAASVGLRLLIRLSHEGDECRDALVASEAHKFIEEAMHVEELCEAAGATLHSLSTSHEVFLDNATVHKLLTAQIVALRSDGPLQPERVGVALQTLGSMIDKIDGDSMAAPFTELMAICIDHSDTESLPVRVLDCLILALKKFPPGDVLQWTTTGRLTAILMRSIRASDKKRTTWILCTLLCSDTSRKELIQADFLDSLPDFLRRIDMDNKKNVLETLVRSVTVTPQWSLPTKLCEYMGDLIISDTTSSELAITCCGVLRNLALVLHSGENWTVPTDWVNTVLSRRPGNNATNHNKLISHVCVLAETFACKFPETTSNAVFVSLLSLLNHFSSEEASYEQALIASAAAALSAVTRTIRADLIALDNDTIDSVIASVYKVIENDRSSTDALAEFLLILVDFCQVDSEAMLYAGVIVVLIDLMVERPTDAFIQETGCVLMAHLTEDKNLQVILSIVQTDGIDTLIGAMTLFADNLDVQRNVTAALANMCVEKESRMLITAQGGLPLLANIVTTHYEDESTMRSTCRVLKYLTAEPDCPIVGEEGDAITLQLVGGTMENFRLHKHSHDLIDSCLDILVSLGRRNSKVRQWAHESRGLDALVSMIGHQTGNKGLISKLLAMCTVLVDEAKTVDVSTLTRAIEASIRALLAYVSDEEIQRTGCSLIEALCRKDAHLVLQMGGKAVLGNAMRFHYSSIVLQRQACRALVKLTSLCFKGITIQATELDVIGLVLSMKRFSSCEDIQVDACTVLRNLIYCESNVPIIEKSKDEVKEQLESLSTRFPQTCNDMASEILLLIG